MISPLSFVSPEAKLGKNVTVSPFAYIDADVEIGDNCVIMPFASIMAGTRMGSGNKVYNGAILGAEPQDFKFKGDKTILRIGNDNTFREKVIINRATFPGGETTVGNGNFLMEGVHILHDAKIGNNCTLGNGTRVAGECVVFDKVILSSSVILHQKCRVGTMAMVEGGCRSNRDIPPFIVAANNPVSFFGINTVILRKEGFSEERIEQISRAYRLIYQFGANAEDPMARVRDEMTSTPDIEIISDFVNSSTLGLVGIQKG